MKISIFEANSVDWIVAETEAEAKAYVLNRYQWENDTWEEYGWIGRELDSDELDQYYVEGKTFRRQLEEMIEDGEKFPCLFATLAN